MSLKEGKLNAYGDEVLSYEDFDGVTSAEQVCDVLKERLVVAKRGVWLDLHGPAACSSILPGALLAGMSIHSGSGESVTLRAWGGARSDHDPCPERAFSIHIVHCLVVRDDGAVLMVKQSYDPKQLFTFPGGFIDVGETIEQASVRETLEETGVQVEWAGLLSMYHAAAFKRATRFGHAAVVHTPLMRVADGAGYDDVGETNTAEEISAAQWVPVSDWSSESWAAAECHPLVRFTLQQLALMPSASGPRSQGDGSPHCVCHASLGALSKAAQAAGGSSAAAAASEGSRSASVPPSGYAGLRVAFDTQGNDGEVEIYCNDLVHGGQVQPWW